MTRANNFDVLRLLAAVTVIFSHSFLIAEGNDNHEPLVMLSDRQAILGHAGVFVFFIISGFLIAQSFETTASPLRYLAKRALRIFPGLFVSLVIAAFVLGVVVTTLPLVDYLRRPEVYGYVIGNTMLDVSMHQLPGVVFVDNSVGLEINGSLWTLTYEFLMYVMVLILGMLRLLRPWMSLLLLALGLACLELDGLHVDTLDVLGGWGWLVAFFAAGMLLYQLRDTRIFDGRLALAALAGLVASVPLRQFIPLFPLFGGYLTIYLALNRRLPIIPATRFGDLSYGLYIYGWPAEQMVVYAHGGHAAWWQVFLLGLLLALALAWLSWHLVEKPSLRLKPRSARLTTSDAHAAAAEPLSGRASPAFDLRRSTRLL